MNNLPQMIGCRFCCAVCGRRLLKAPPPRLAISKSGLRKTRQFLEPKYNRRCSSHHGLVGFVFVTLSSPRPDLACNAGGDADDANGADDRPKTSALPSSIDFFHPKLCVACSRHFEIDGFETFHVSAGNDGFLLSSATLPASAHRGGR